VEEIVMVHYMKRQEYLYAMKMIVSKNFLILKESVLNVMKLLLIVQNVVMIIKMKGKKKYLNV